jgi:hypothetical protein
VIGMKRQFTKRLLAIVCVTVLMGTIVIAVMMWPDDVAGPCVVVQHTTMLPDIPEASSLAVSRRNPGILWSHNDSGNAAVLFALDASGTLRGQVRVPIVTRDWEDVSAARCPAGDCLYIADIGDNGLARRNVQIYRVLEPAPTDVETAPPEVFTATYADGPHNAEALFVVGANIFIVTRDRTGGLYRSTRLDPGVVDLKLERIGELGLGAVTDAEASRDEASIAVRTSHVVMIYRTTDLIRGGKVPSGLSIPIDGLKESQGEAVALDGNMLFLASEGRPWNRAGRFISLRCSYSAGNFETITSRVLR